MKIVRQMQMGVLTRGFTMGAIACKGNGQGCVIAAYPEGHLHIRIVWRQIPAGEGRRKDMFLGSDLRVRFKIRDIDNGRI